jgi:hypothetical protein
MKKHLFSILSLALLAGCCTVLTPDLIVKKNFDNYVHNSSGKDSHYEMDAALKEFIYEMVNNPPSNLNEIKERRSSYLEKLKVQNISSNYPVMIKKEEREIVKRFLKDLIKYSEEYGDEANSQEIVSFFCVMSHRFIEEVDEYEYSLENVE